MLVMLSALRGPGMLLPCHAMPCYALHYLQATHPAPALVGACAVCVLEDDRPMPCWKLHDVSPWDGLPFHLAPAVVVPWFEGWIPG